MTLILMLEVRGSMGSNGSADGRPTMGGGIASQGIGAGGPNLKSPPGKAPQVGFFVLTVGAGRGAGPRLCAAVTRSRPVFLLR